MSLTETILHLSCSHSHTDSMMRYLHQLILLLLLTLLPLSSRAEECESLDGKLIEKLNKLEKQQEQILLRLGKAKSRGGVLGSCSDAPESGIYRVNIAGRATRVYCKMVNYQMWMVVQRRIDGSLNFTKSWIQYQKGFGSPDREFWIGNEHLHQLTTTRTAMKLRVELTTNTQQSSFAEYDEFWVENSFEHYALHVNRYSGPAGDALKDNRKRAFSAYDQSHDGFGTMYWCDKDSPRDNGAWWNKQCTKANLNGQYGNRYHEGMFWEGFIGIWYKNRDHTTTRYIATSEMMIRER